MKITKITLATELISITQNIEAKKISAEHPLYNTILRGTKAQIQEKIEAALKIKKNAKEITKKHNTKITENAMARAKAEKPKRIEVKFNTEIKPKKAIAVKPKTKNEESKMEAVETKFEMTEGFVIGTKDVTQWKWGKNVKAKAATEAVVAVKGIAAVEEVKTQPAIKANKKKGIEASPAVAAVAAVKAVKAIKAQDAKPATPASIEMYMRCLSQEIAEEFAARMAAEGLIANYDEVIFEEEIDGKKCFCLSFTAEDAKIIRAAMRPAKSKDGYNKAGLAAIKAKEKADAKALKADAKGKDPVVEVVEEVTEKEEAGWPESEKGFDE